MSQAKVDKYKENKKNREKILKKEKAKKVTSVVVVALIIGALLGIPIGKGLYKHSVEVANAKKTVNTMNFEDWFYSYITEQYPDLYAGTSAGDGTSSEDELLDDIINSDDSVDSGETDLTDDGLEVQDIGDLEIAE